MRTTDENPYVFPQDTTVWTETASGKAIPGAVMRIGGMTLRDYFAAQALTGILMMADRASTPSVPFAAQAYIFADAMLAARQTNS